MNLFKCLNPKETFIHSTQYPKQAKAIDSQADLVWNLPKENHTQEAKFNVELATVRAMDMIHHVKTTACFYLLVQATRLSRMAPSCPRDDVPWLSSTSSQCLQPIRQKPSAVFEEQSTCKATYSSFVASISKSDHWLKQPFSCFYKSLFFSCITSNGFSYYYICHPFLHNAHPISISFYLRLP